MANETANETPLCCLQSATTKAWAMIGGCPPANRRRGPKAAIAIFKLHYPLEAALSPGRRLRLAWVGALEGDEQSHAKRSLAERWHVLDGPTEDFDELLLSQTGLWWQAKDRRLMPRDQIGICPGHSQGLHFQGKSDCARPRDLGKPIEQLIGGQFRPGGRCPGEVQGHNDHADYGPRPHGSRDPIRAIQIPSDQRARYLTYVLARLFATSAKSYPTSTTFGHVVDRQALHRKLS